MLARRLVLAERRGRLRAEIAGQRQQLSQQIAPLEAALGLVDQGVSLASQAGRGLRRHPAWVGAAVAVLVVLRPRPLWRWSRRAWLAWKTYRRLRTGVGL